MFIQSRFITVYSMLIFWQAISVVIGSQSFPSVVDTIINFFNIFI